MGGRFVRVSGCMEWVWLDVFDFRYAVREGSSKVKIFKNFKEKKTFKPELGAEGKGKGERLVITYFLIRYIWWPPARSEG